MMLQLHGRHLRALSPSSEEPFIARITERVETNGSTDEILLSQSGEELPSGHRAYLLRAPTTHTIDARDAYALAQSMWYLVDGDVVRIDPQRHTITALYRRNSPSNALLVTERCDNYCLMCSQPPRIVDDSWLVGDLLRVIDLMSPETREIGITGGEPTLLGAQLTRLLERLRDRLPATGVHVLSNGRRCADPTFADLVGRIGHPNMMFGIPLYSDVAEEHDYVVQRRGAFSETIRGILNLKRAGVRVEVRFVILQSTYIRMPEFARFVARNLRFVDHVALMGLELKGFARRNLETVWIDPVDYQTQLVETVHRLDQAGLAVSIYNHQLCVLDKRLHRFARKSISDWKNMYLDACNSCSIRDDCGGFFASSTLRYSRGIRPFV